MLTESLRVQLEPQLRVMARKIPIVDFREDVEQEAWVAVICEAERHPEVPYLASVARHRVTDVMRGYRRRQQREQAVRLMPEPVGCDMASIDLLLDELPSKWRKLLVLYMACGGDTADLARALGISRTMSQRKVQHLRRIVVGRLLAPGDPLDV